MFKKKIFTIEVNKKILINLKNKFFFHFKKREKKNKNFENIIDFLEKKPNKRKVYFDIFNNLHTLYELQIFYQKNFFFKIL